MPRVKEAEQQKKRSSRRCKRQARSHQEEAGAPPEPAAAASHEIAMRCEKDSTEGLAAIVSSCSPLPFPGMEETMTSSTTPKRPLYPIFEASEDAVDEDAIEDIVAQHVEKKRRLSVEQVKSLEKYFELENKLEPERKLQLARELGLQPRQVAVWFQNRRARWKTKQLEKDYDALKANLDTLKADYNTLLQEKQKLEAEVDRLNNLLSSKSEAAIETPEKPDIKVKVEVEVGTVANRDAAGSKEQDPESGFGDALNFKKDCSSSDSDDSEIVDDESPRPMESESGFSLNHHQPCSGVLDMDPLECHIPDESYAHVVYTRIPKLEDGSSFQDDSCTGTRFLDLEEQDQGSLSWWDWA